MAEKYTLPSKEEVDAISDRERLHDILDDIDRGIEKMHVDLEFEVGDEEWDKRARAALTAFRIRRKDVVKRINRVSGRVAVTKEVEAKNSENKTERAKLAAEKAKADAEKKAASAEAMKVSLTRQKINIINRTSYLSSFHQAAFELLSKEDFSALSARAHDDHLAAIKQEVSGGAE